MNQNRQGNRGGSPANKGSKDKRNSRNSSQRNRNKGRDQNRKRRSRGSGNRGKPQNQVEYKPKIPDPKMYGVVFFDTVEQAKRDLEGLAAKAGEVDQLNIVIQAEGPIEDEELAGIGKVFAGAAWTTIHTRRQEEGWYNSPQ